MNPRALLVVGLATWAGATLLLAEIRWFRTPRLADRLAAYAPAEQQSRRAALLSAGSFREVIGPLARAVGEAISSALRVDDDLSTRLVRIHSPLDPTAFRIRQLGYSVLTSACAVSTALLVTLPAPLVALLLTGAPALTFLAFEQQLSNAGARWQRRIFLELPVVAEQLGMLLSAGYSLGSALNRLAQRGRGACSQDLRRACARIRYGATEIDALREWRDLARVDALDRLVAVLSLNREAGDLGRLISDEARAIRRDAQRELTEAIERRAQLVWIPVTVAALLPGTLFLVVPFIEAMRLFTNP